MGLFDSLFGDARGAARAAESRVGALTAGARGRVDEAATLVDERAQASAGESRELAAAFRALADQSPTLERQSAQRSGRGQAQAEQARQGLIGRSGGLGEVVSLAQVQSLMAERSSRIQRQIGLNQAIAAQLAQAGQVSQAGAAARLQSITAFEQNALQAQTQLAMLRAQAEGQPSALGRFAGGALTALAGRGVFDGLFGGSEAAAATTTGGGAKWWLGG